MWFQLPNYLGTVIVLWCWWFRWVSSNRLGTSCSVWTRWLHCSCWWLKTSPPKSCMSVTSHNMVERRGLVWGALLLVCKWPKKFVHINCSSSLLKGVWGYLIPPKSILLASSALAASALGGCSGLAVEHCHLHTVAWHYTVSNMLAISQVLQAYAWFISVSSPLSTLPEGCGTRKKEGGQSKLHHKSLSSRRQGE